MKKLIVVCLLMAVLSASCGGGGGDGDGNWDSEVAAIEDTIRGYVETYNAQDYPQCLTYFTEYGDEGDALAALAFLRGLSGELEYREIKDITISGTNTATVMVVFVIGGEEGSDELQLKKVEGDWKIVWESTEPSPVINGNGNVAYREYSFTCEYVQDGPPETPYELCISGEVVNAGQANVEISSVVCRFYNQAGEMIGNHTSYQLYGGNTIAPGWGHGVDMGSHVFYFSEEVVRYEVTVTDREGKEYAWP